MSVLLRDRDKRAQRSRLTLQVLYRRELGECGRRRAGALAEAEAELLRIARFLPGALHAGMTLTEISQLTGVSRPTLYALRSRRPLDSPEDILFALLSALAGLGPQTTGQLAGVVGIAADDAEAILTDLVTQGVLSWLIGYSTPANQAAYLVLTELGAKRLEELLVQHAVR